MQIESHVLPREAARENQAKAAPSQRTTVLLIEDNPDDALLIEFMISDSGGDLFEFERVEDLEAGLRRLQSPGVGIILCDLSLPDSHGLETFARLHAQAQ